MQDILALDPETLRRTSLADLREMMRALGVSAVGVTTPEEAQARLVERAAITPRE